MQGGAAYEPPPNGFRTFVIVWATQSLSTLGSVVGWFALTVWLSQQIPTQEELGSKLAIIGLLGAIPPSLLAPLAGTWADRHDRKRTMLVCNLLSAGLTLAASALLYTGQMSFAALAVVGFLYQSLGSFHSSAFDTSYAMLIRDDQLPRANGMMQTVFSMSSVMAPGIAALLLALPTGAAGAMLIDGVTFLLSAVVLTCLHIPSPRRADLVGAGRKSFRADALEGARFIWLRRPILWLLLTFTISNFAGASLNVLTPVLVKFRLAANAQAVGLDFTASLAAIQSALGIGGVLGGVLFTTWGGLKRRRAYGVVVPILITGVLHIVFGLNTFIYVAIGLVFLQSLMMPTTNSHSQAIWQTQTPREMQGRVFAVRRLIAWVANPVATAVVGLLTGRGVDPSLIIVTLGTVSVLWCAANLFNPQLIRVDEKGYLEAFAARQLGTATPET